MKTFKTPKGTALPLRDMRGKDYLDVQYRVLWMREEHPDWGIETSFITLNETVAIAHATIRDASGKILAQGTKTETPKDFGDFVEKAETGSVGRALALCGYGTQFAQELEEGERIVDSPREPKGKPVLQAVSDPGAYIVKIGKKFPGKRLNELDIYELNDWVAFLKEGKSNNQSIIETISACEAFLATRTPKAANEAP